MGTRQRLHSVVPVQFDMTAHHAMQELNTWNFNAKTDLLIGLFIGIASALLGCYAFVKSLRRIVSWMVLPF
jgi:hypothetical protein